MKIVNILGGIGNQMFQYAFMIALREATGCETAYDASVFKTYPLHNGFELEKYFNITCRQATRQEISKLTYFTTSYFWWRVIKRYFPRKKTQQYEPQYGVYSQDILDDKSDLYYIGNWQNPNYFDPYKDVILKEFAWKIPLDAKNQEAFDYLSDNYSVSIHIRRGDYLKNWRYRNICELDYYVKSISYVKDKIHGPVVFAIFSNDIPWCQENIIPLIGDSQYLIVDWNQGQSSYNDIRLMTACKCNIIANSSFSWWAAYMNINTNPLIIAPTKWTNADVHYKRQLDNWLLID